MAIYHLSAKVMGRSTGRSVVAAAAYRSGTRLVDGRTGVTHDYGRKRVEHAEIIAPAGAPAWVRDRQALWNAVEAAERRKDAQLAREVEVALPRELSAEGRLGLLRAFVAEQFVASGMVADVAIHCPKAADGRDAPHAHILLTLRPLDGSGFGKKERGWNDVAKLERWRASWAEAANLALERGGETARIDHRTLEAQGIAREPEPKLGITRRLAELYGDLRDRFNQWVAVRHRNRVRDHVAAVGRIDPGEIARMIGVRLAMQPELAPGLAGGPVRPEPELDR